MTTKAGYPEPGEMFGTYRIVRRLGGGGMGVVFEAVDTTLDRSVALKVISPALDEDETFRSRFRAEAQGQASLDSPHVVSVFAHGEVDGRLYIATQLVPDGDLGACLSAHGPPSLATGVDLIAQIAAGLGEAHRAGVIHRDLKPANVLLRRRASEVHAYLADFGIARQVGRDQGWTAAGTVGTPRFMAPELHTGAIAGPSSDLYSLGCLLWATLTGTPPYAGNSDYELIRAHLESPIPQLASGGLAEEQVNQILRRSLAKQPAERYQSAAAMRADLLAAAKLPDQGPSRMRSRRLWRMVAALTGAALLVTVGYVGVVRGGATEQLSQADRQRARSNMASVIAATLPRDAVDAGCVADEWIADSGLATLIEEGFFDEDLDFIDLEEEQMTDATRAAALRAVSNCTRE